MSDHYLVTGNEFVSLPAIRQNDASIDSFTVLHMGFKGMLSFHGDADFPLIKPTVTVDDIPVPYTEPAWEYAEYWIPQFDSTAEDIHIKGIILCPLEHRGFALRYTLQNQSKVSKKVTFCLTGSWAGVMHCVNQDKEVDGRKVVYNSSWSGEPVFDLRLGVPTMAFAVMSSLTMIWNTESKEDSTHYNGSYSGTINSGEEMTLDFFWGVGFEEVAAVTAAKEQLRHGFDALYHRAKTWLTGKRRTVGDIHLDEILNKNLFFSYFYATGHTIDTEEVVMVTSRSPRYYVSAAYWDRDSLLWSFPAILHIDKDHARSLLEYVFTRQSRNIGIHSRYIDGAVLEPGFELDELCAPVLALARYVNFTNDTDILSEPYVEKSIRRILGTLDTKRSSKLGLYETFLLPTDDMRTYPYVTYNNVLAWRMLKDILDLYRYFWDTEMIQLLEDKVQTLHNSILCYCVKEYEGRRVFVWSVSEDGEWDIYDEPPGSLQLLPSLGFCDFMDTVWQSTVDIIRRPEYPYSFAGKPFADIGCAHAPHPWIISVCNSLLCGRIEESVDFLKRAPMDNGFACESVDEYTGVCATGEAFATCAGFLASCMITALHGARNKSPEPPEDTL